MTNPSPVLTDHKYRDTRYILYKQPSSNRYYYYSTGIVCGMVYAVYSLISYIYN